MNSTKDDWITTLIFEHACKEDFNVVVKGMLLCEGLGSKIVQNCTSSEIKTIDQPQIQPIFILIYLLKKLHSLESFAVKSSSDLNVLSSIIELLESTYRQYNFMSLKRYFTLTSELRLLDLLNIITNDTDSTLIIQKLNQHFPRWTANYKTDMEKKFSIENSKVLDKVEESHTQCRRLIFKLAVDKAYKVKYLSEQYPNDVNRLVKESKDYIKEAFTTLESLAGPSMLEKMADNEESGFKIPDDVSIQLLLDYCQPRITDESLLKFLDDFEPTLNSQPTSCLTSCLLPFDTMSEVGDEEEEGNTEESSSEYESSDEVEESAKSSTNGG